MKWGTTLRSCLPHRGGYREHKARAVPAEACRPQQAQLPDNPEGYRKLLKCFPQGGTGEAVQFAKIALDGHEKGPVGMMPRNLQEAAEAAGGGLGVTWMRQ